jgi:MEMO1 family protein
LLFPVGDEMGVAMLREPVVAGQFYPSNPKRLRDDLDSYCRFSGTLTEAKAIVAPHAGYMYSGPVAGAVYGAIQIPTRAILLGPNHTGRGTPLSLYPAGEWRTPLGLVQIDDEINRRLMQECTELSEDQTAHLREHSLEVQVPFLQLRVPDIRISAVCIGTGAFATLETLGHALARTILSIKDPVLIVSSSDMTHYAPADVAASQDRFAINKMLAVDPKGLYREVKDKGISMCGFAPTVAALTACRDLGATSGRLMRYATSGDVSGDFASVVGYAALLIA